MNILWPAVLAWVLAQTAKTVIHWMEHGKFDLARLIFGSGGMPSSHTAFVAAIAVGAGQRAGYDTVQFGVRRAAGRQARVLNEILEHLSKGDATWPQQMERLRELLGHTPFQVVIGLILGAVTALIFN
ncbi:MAG: divergent PAP2 family protein [Christensenellales bacterium]|jgi:acid phosphatase family membrane protein YuiD